MSEPVRDIAFSQVDKNCAESYLATVPISAFGQNVKRIRLSKDPPLKAKELAKSIGTDASVVSRWEQGHAGLPEGPTLIRLAKSLEVSVEQLLDGVDDDYTAFVRSRHGVVPLSPPKSVVDEAAAERKRHTATLNAVEGVADRLIRLLVQAGRPPSGKVNKAATRTVRRRRQGDR